MREGAVSASTSRKKFFTPSLPASLKAVASNPTSAAVFVVRGQVDTCVTATAQTCDLTRNADRSFRHDGTHAGPTHNTSIPTCAAVVVCHERGLAAVVLVVIAIREAADAPQPRPPAPCLCLVIQFTAITVAPGLDVSPRRTSQTASPTVFVARRDAAAVAGDLTWWAPTVPNIRRIAAVATIDERIDPNPSVCGCVHVSLRVASPVGCRSVIATDVSHVVPHLGDHARTDKRREEQRHPAPCLVHCPRLH